MRTRSIPIVCTIALALLGGCRSVGIPVLRTNFPSGGHVQARCAEYEHDPQALSESVSEAYREGWRIAYVSESSYGLFIFQSPRIQICYERQSPSEAVRTEAPPASRDRRSVASETAPVTPSTEPRPPITPAEPAVRTPVVDSQDLAALKTLVGGQIARKGGLLSSCQRAYGKDVSSAIVQLTVTSTGTISEVEVPSVGSGLATCMQRVLKTVSVAPAPSRTSTVEVEVTFSH